MNNITSYRKEKRKPSKTPDQKLKAVASSYGYDIVVSKLGNDKYEAYVPGYNRMPQVLYDFIEKEYNPIGFDRRLFVFTEFSNELD